MLSTTNVYVRLSTSAVNGATGNISVTSNIAATVNIPTGTAVVTDIPVATATSPNTSACEFTAINLNGSVSGGFGSGYVYDWNGPNSFTSSDQSPNVTDSAQTPMDGTYTLVVTDGNSCSSLAAQVNITVHVLPVIDVGNSEEFCYDDGNQTLVGSPTGGSWSGSGIVNASEFSILLLPVMVLKKLFTAIVMVILVQIQTPNK